MGARSLVPRIAPLPHVPVTPLVGAVCLGATALVVLAATPGPARQKRRLLLMVRASRLLNRGAHLLVAEVMVGWKVPSAVGLHVPSVTGHGPPGWELSLHPSSRGLVYRLHLAHGHFLLRL